MPKPLFSCPPPKNMCLVRPVGSIPRSGISSFLSTGFSKYVYNFSDHSFLNKQQKGVSCDTPFLILNYFAEEVLLRVTSW